MKPQAAHQSAFAGKPCPPSIGNAHFLVLALGLIPDRQFD
jgi:hypothetical protein